MSDKCIIQNFSQNCTCRIPEGHRVVARSLAPVLEKMLASSAAEKEMA
jgi:hypothetical protein